MFTILPPPSPSSEPLSSSKSSPLNSTFLRSVTFSFNLSISPCISFLASSDTNSPSKSFSKDCIVFSSKSPYNSSTNALASVIAGPLLSDLLILVAYSFTIFEFFQSVPSLVEANIPPIIKVIASSSPGSSPMKPSNDSDQV